MKELVLVECDMFLIGLCVWAHYTQKVVLFGKLWIPRLKARSPTDRMELQDLEATSKETQVLAKLLSRASGVLGSVLGILIMIVFIGGGRGLCF